jgi:hypothetical protein
VFAVGPDAVAPRLTEDEFVLRLPARTRGVAGHGLVSAAEQGDVARVRARLRDGGFDGAVVVWMGAGKEGEPIASRTFGDVYAAAQQGASTRSSTASRPTSSSGRPPAGRSDPTTRAR